MFRTTTTSAFCRSVSRAFSIKRIPTSSSSSSTMSPRTTERLDAHPRAGLAVTDSTIVDDNNTVLGIHGRDLKIDGPFGAYSMPSIGADYVQPGRDYCRNHMIPWNTIRARAAAKGESHIEFDCRDARGVEDLPRSAVGRPNLQSHAGGREGHVSQKHVMSRACITFTAFATATPRLGSVGQHRHVAPHS